ncbi:hypothetical protein GCM10010339_20260 [Streptomyces alanosinicus]|uniref:Amine oxidase n=1 Tax=Streptomyces alanosinicus TaxID=68171 RepID=A0A918YFH1_9ACTN|nr:hypothetical protein GCM10010339_20260 [Streptomyces alanosinicus]
MLKSVKLPDPVDPARATVNGLCATTRSRGHPYRMHDAGTDRVYQTQGKDFLVCTVHQVGWYEYITEWRFQDDGTIASDNPRCGHGHPSSVDNWVDGQTLTHPVIWMNVGFHHIARDEDQQPLPVHWQGFAIAPRDVTAMNPLTPRDPTWQNGHWGWPS